MVKITQHKNKKKKAENTKELLDACKLVHSNNQIN